MEADETGVAPVVLKSQAGLTEPCSADRCKPALLPFLLSYRKSSCQIMAAVARHQIEIPDWL